MGENLPKAGRYPHWRKDFIADSNVMDISPDVIDACVALRKGKKIKTSDAIIAATAIVHKLTLLTRNPKDFKNIKGLTVIDPHTLEKKRKQPLPSQRQFYLGLLLFYYGIRFIRPRISGLGGKTGRGRKTQASMAVYKTADTCSPL